MATRRYLAMRLAEFEKKEVLPAQTAWMVCPFSPEWMTPPVLSPSSLLILTDEVIPEEISLSEHSALICQTLQTMDCTGIVLDFQKPRTPQTAAFAAGLAAALPCPVAVPEAYAAELDCPVFLSPCPHHTALSEHLAPWKNREVWLDLAMDAESIALTPKGADITPVSLSDFPSNSHHEKNLHCHYSIETGADLARFTLWRTKEDVDNLQQAAEALGVHTFAGLWQELG